ncbi:MAG: glycosyltransferase [Propionibacteriaceae bacterium]
MPTAARSLTDPALITVPARHEYVTAVRPPGVQTVRTDRVRGWEPDPFLRPENVAAWAAEIDVVHLHFGFDHLDRTAVRRWLEALADARLPLVFTVHDLRNPHHLDRGAHDAALVELTAAATALLTLTPGAAAEIRRRFRRRAAIVPHPTLVDPARTVDVPTEPGLVTVHLKSLRRNLADPVDLLRAAARGAGTGGGRLRVDLHPDVAEDPRLAGLREIPDVEVAVHPRYDDLDLERYLRRSHVTVLPHRWGTHSGWLELARDLGTAVVAPSCGYYAEQWPAVHSFGNDEEHGLDADSLARAVARALSRPAPPPADRRERLAQADTVRTVHAEVYARALERVRRPVVRP